MKRLPLNRLMAYMTMFACVAALFLSCAQERATINRVQPNALKKVYFVGEDLQDPMDDPEFWTQASLIDVGYGAEGGLFNSTFTQNLSRMRWDITEDYLFGRLAYERIDGSDGKGVGQATQDGQIVVAFRIESHFDVIRSYNPTTGEELNILMENTTDRPWNERAYMRVDWSKNLAADSYDFDTLSMIGVYYGVTYEPLGYDVTAPNHPHAPVFDLENGYFDVTNKAFAKPGLLDLSHLGWGIDSFPACMLPAEFSGGREPVGNCNPTELTVRHSFRRVVDTDFQPKHWDGYRFQAAGGFYVSRFGYDRNYGMSDDKWHRFLNHYQIWERSHYYEDPETMTGAVECFTPATTPVGSDPNRDANNNGTEDECESVGQGSKCDRFKQKCTLPFMERTTRTLPWYYTQTDTEEYFGSTKEAVHQWDVAIRVAARTAQYAECQNTGNTDCLERFPIYFGQMDDNLDAINLAREVDACRNGYAYEGQDCDALADQIGADRNYEPGVIAVAKMPELIVLCHSPVQMDDPEACGEARLPDGLSAEDCGVAAESGDWDTVSQCKEALTVRQGDLRYHKVNVFYAPQSPSPWGIYADAEDPLTGETVSASINVWAWVNDYYSQYYVDVMRYMAGELTTEQVTDGEYVRHWIRAAEAAEKSGALPQLSRAQIDRRVASFSGVNPADLPRLESLPAGSQAMVQEAKSIKRKLSGYRFDSQMLTTNRAEQEARRQSAAGTTFEAELMTPMVQQATGTSGMPLTHGVMNQASPLRGANPSFKRDLRQMWNNALAESGHCIIHAENAAAPLALSGLSDRLQQKFGAFSPDDSLAVQLERAEKIRKYFAHRLNMTVIVHEMGHSVGARHNFVSSSDAWQYRPQYWQLRTKNGTVTDECTDLVADGESCVGPRWFDPVTQEERDGMIYMFMASSVMDYAGDISQDMIGLGIWDWAAAKMFYGESAVMSTDPKTSLSGIRAQDFLGKMDNFGGILGIQWTEEGEDIHYSRLQSSLGLIKDCYTVADPTVYKPATWNEEEDGSWDPLLDGMMVQVDGQWTRCKQPKVDYVPWKSLRNPTEEDLGDTYYRGGPSVDKSGRLRMPYGFATDRWADLGNVSVYRHDNGADAYEIFNYFITQQEVGHIFDNYRRGRQTFSVRNSSNRTLARYNEKIRDGAKGLGLMRNIYEEFGMNNGYDFRSYWPFVSNLWFRDNLVASGLVFDHFARMMSRPEVGEHFMDTNASVLRSVNDDFSSGGTTVVTIPNGATGYYDSVSYGGKLVENQLAENQGEYDAEYTINCGSYYDKINTAYLMTESVDNFISDSRLDYVDPRYRAVSLADLFPEGYRRWIGTMLTNDEAMKGGHLAASAGGEVLTDSDGYPAEGMGWPVWWAADPYVCFPGEGGHVCGSYGQSDNTPFHPLAPDRTVVVDPQVGWEQQKFVIAFTLLYLPENERYHWLDMMDIWELGRDADPEFENRIEFHAPWGEVFIAQTYGTEELFGKTVQKGIAARVLQQANEYLQAGFETTDGSDLDGDGNPDWFFPVLGPGGEPVVKYDPSIQTIDLDGNVVAGYPGCNSTENHACTCSANRACYRLQQYISVPTYLREALTAYQLGHPSQAGFY
jgi:hypothetical protein